MNFIESVLTPTLIGTFIAILTWVALSLVVFEILNIFTKDKFYAAMENSKRGQVLFAALLGLIPGCGGALLLVPLYNKRKISFAALTAGFISTFGDVAFVILAIDPLVFLNLLWIGFLVALIWGYLLEWTKLNDYIENRINQPLRKGRKELATDEKINDTGWWNREKKRLPHWFLSFDRYYAPAIVGLFVLMIFPGTIMKVVPSWSELSAVSIFEKIALVGTITIIIINIFRRSMMKMYVSRDYHDHMHADHIPNQAKYSSCDTTTKTSSCKTGNCSKKISETSGETYSCAVNKNKRDETLHMINDVYVNIVWLGTWIFVGLFSFETLFYLIGDNLNNFFELGNGFMGILIGILVGLIPGCGAQIAFANFYFGSNLLFSSMVGNSINQDGDAAFAFISSEPRSAFWMRLMNILPAFIFSTIVFSMEISGVITI